MKDYSESKEMYIRGVKLKETSTLEHTNRSISDEKFIENMATAADYIEGEDPIYAANIRKVHKIKKEMD